MKHLFLLLVLTFSACVFSQTTDVPVPDDPVAVSYNQPDITPDYSVPVVEPVTSATPVDAPKTIEGIFATFFALVAFIPIAVQFLRKLLIPNSKGLPVQIFSWVTGIIITITGWLLHLGFLNGLSFWVALLYGAGVCLAANGVFDTGLVTAIFGLFEKKSSK